MSEDLQQMLTESNLQVGDLVTGEVASIDSNGVTVHLEHGFEGFVPIRELSVLPVEDASTIVSIGSKVNAVVKNIDRESGQVTLSKRLADSREAWDKLQNAFANQETLEITVHDVVKGGLVTDVGVRGFIPASLLDTRFVGNLEEYKGQTLQVKIAEIDRDNNKLILSRKAVLENEQNQKVQKVISELHEGDILEGVVQRLTSFGAFVDIHGVDGLVHISELSWNHADHPSDVVNEGQTVKVKVLKLDPEKGKISLSIKQAEPDPFEKYATELQVGSVVNGVVKRVVDFGAFVELKPGLEGLVHVSQISHQRVNHPSDVLHPGDKVEVKILGVDYERKRVSLSIKDVQERPVVSKKDVKSKPSAPANKESESVTGTGATLGDLFGDLFKKGND
ncbi:30S ribosomal protein S1 [Alicyclobacillus tolerans]|uniref:Small subunit ribosomal protein S1 n=2 Tax=Alicyclobacillus tolerans TaxID=90970 RepID=A0ABT9M017_9BACL|nr:MULTISPECIES: 30S ribosomal protein S1 [Alicyclobacillus]MDP9729842.1 small subunit ribosomal protein S1 [Alicyclobacillus tengchongensis]QRF23324.1 30S ribosomal protein S1 [Alicyclobacillus sp. TC]SHL03849.1 SSU ribosomal protein S1P [Alicyclobacillus montanus]